MLPGLEFRRVPFPFGIGPRRGRVWISGGEVSLTTKGEQTCRRHCLSTRRTRRRPASCSRGWCSCFFFFFSSRRRHTRCYRDWSSDVCSSDLYLDIHEDDQLGEAQLAAWV